MTRRRYICRLIHRCYADLERRWDWNQTCPDGQCVDLGATLVLLDLSWQIRGYWATGRHDEANRVWRRLRRFQAELVPDEDEVEVEDWEFGGES